MLYRKWDWTNKNISGLEMKWHIWLLDARREKIQQGKSTQNDDDNETMLWILTCINSFEYVVSHISHAHLHITTDTDTNKSIIMHTVHTVRILIAVARANSSFSSNAIYKRINSSIPNKSLINRFYQIKEGDTLK